MTLLFPCTSLSFTAHSCPNGCVHCPPLSPPRIHSSHTVLLSTFTTQTTHTLTAAPSLEILFSHSCMHTCTHTHTDLDTCWQLPIPAGKMNGISLAWAVNDWVGLGRRRYSNGGKLRTRWERHGGVGQQATERNLDNFSPMITSVMCSCLSKEASIHFTTSGITG